MAEGMQALSAKRIQKELEEITLNPPQNCSVVSKNDDTPYEWMCSIKGPEGSAYEGGLFFLDIFFSIEYPVKPPQIRFKTRIYHCNINAQGEVCIDILHNWTSSSTISKLLEGICSLLSFCNPNDPLVGTIAKKYIQDKDEHDRLARLWTKRFAT